jgi:biotin carboxyl carrier protein
VKLQISIDGRLTTLDSAEQASIHEIAYGLYSVLYGGRSYEVRIQNSGGEWRAMVADRSFAIEIQDPRNGAGRVNATLAHTHQDVRAPMPGKVIRMLVREADEVQAGQGLAVVEAMKMQNELKALRAGRVLRVAVKDGDTVGAGDVLVTLE